MGHLVILSAAWWGVSNASGTSNFVIKIPWSRAGGARHIGTMGYSSFGPVSGQSRQYPVIATDDRMGFCYGTTDFTGDNIKGMTFQWTIVYCTASTSSTPVN